jgi:membrane protein YqaA with SNARE-associated domain
MKIDEEGAGAGPVTTRVERRSLARRIHARLQGWADAGWSGSVVFAWGVLQGGIVPGFADLFFIPLSVARPDKAYRLALIAAAGTIVGNTLLYLAGTEALAMFEGPLAALVGLTPERFDAARAALAEYGGLAILASTLGPLSSKLTSIASGAVGVPLMEFVLFLSAGRTGRTLATAWLIRNGGAEWIRKALRI